MTSRESSRVRNRSRPPDGRYPCGRRRDDGGILCVLRRRKKYESGREGKAGAGRIVGVDRGLPAGCGARDRSRAVFDAALSPLGFECRQDAYEGEGGTTDTVLAWTSERYGVTVHFLVSQSWLTSFNYYTGELRSDGSGADPTVLADLPDRVPAWFTAARSSARSS